jgi:DNA-binding NarL/FixJ family response regulator
MADLRDAPRRGGIGVLVVDDAAAMRELLGVVLELNPELWLAGEAADGQEAIEQAERLQPDVVLLDLSLPIRTGIDALPEIKAVAPAARVIAFTGFSDSAVEDTVLAAGADGFLLKGAAPAAIIDMILAASSAGPDSQARDGDRRSSGVVARTPPTNQP